MVQPVSPEALILWVGVVGLTLGFFAFTMVWRDETDHRSRQFVRRSTVLPAVSTLAYASMATGIGIVTTSIGGETATIYWARYADLLVTLPLLVCLFATFAGADRTTVQMLGGITVLSVSTWLVSGLAVQMITSVGLWVLGSLFFLALASLLGRRLETSAIHRSEHVAQTVMTFRNLLIVLLTPYPIIWLFGPESPLGVVDATTATAAYMILDLLAKVGLPYLLIRNRHLYTKTVDTQADNVDRNATV